MWTMYSCPDPTPWLVASAFAGGGAALACDYLRRAAVVRAAQERAASLLLGLAHLCALWGASEWYDNPRPPIVAAHPAPPIA